MAFPKKCASLAHLYAALAHLYASLAHFFRREQGILHICQQKRDAGNAGGTDLIKYIVSLTSINEMRKQIYLAVTERLKTLRGEDGEPVVKHMDLWNEQRVLSPTDDAALLPAVLVEFMPIEWKTVGGGAQWGNVQFRLHVVTKTHEGAGQDETLQLFDLLDSIHNTLNGLRGERFRQLVRTSSITDHKHDELVESIEAFQISVDDVSGRTDA